jgi:hypothetical protein
MCNTDMKREVEDYGNLTTLYSVMMNICNVLEIFFYKLKDRYEKLHIPIEKTIYRKVSHSRVYLNSIIIIMLIFVCLFVCLDLQEQFFSHLATVTITGDRAANSDLCLALTAFSSERSFTCHTGASVFKVISVRPVISHF